MLATALSSWQPLDTWIAVTGALIGAACALPGCFLLLRRMSLMGDAISHAVLPGLAVAFLVSGQRDSLTMFVGAAIVGVLTAFFTQWLHSRGGVEQSAAMGVVFTVLFALGLILIRQAADHVDLDPGCVLYGSIEYVPLDTIPLLGGEVPRATLRIGVMLLLNALFVLLFFKELRITAFDPALAATLGYSPRLMHYLTMTIVSLTTVAAFESVGSILVIAMLIVPAAAAHLLTDRLAPLLLCSVLVAGIAAFVGHGLALALPAWVGFGPISVSSAGMMSVTLGGLFGAAWLLAPRHGLLARSAAHLRLRWQILREDLLGELYRRHEPAFAPDSRSASVPSADDGPRGAPARLGLQRRVALALLRWRGLVRGSGREVSLTAAGLAAAARLVRSHRLWETYLDRHLAVPADHVHAPAAVLEHVTDPGMQERLAASIDDPALDPHGAPIPPRIGG